MIPPLDARGLLPPGIHDATWVDVATLFNGCARRRHLQVRLRAFLDDELRPRGWSTYPIIIGGSCLSDKPSPDDIEVTLLAGGAPKIIQGDIIVHWVFQRASFKQQYEVDYYPTLPGMNDFGRFFQYVGEKTAADKRLAATDLRGVLRLVLW